MNTRILTCLVGFVLVAAACGATDSDPAPVEEAAATTQPAAEVATTAAPDATGAPAELGTSDFDASGEPLVMIFSPVPPGVYVDESLGMAFSLTIGDNWFMQPNGPGYTVLTDPDSFGPGDRDVVFFRPSVLYDPTEPALPPEEQGEWPVGDLEGWIDNLVDGIEVSEPQAAMLGGRDALVFDVTLADAFQCGPAYCAGFADAKGLFLKGFDRNVDYRVWWVDGGDYEPLAVVVGGGPTGTDFFVEAEALLSTLAFGDEAGHPVPDENPWACGIESPVSAGEVVVPVAGGMKIDVPFDTFLGQRPGWMDLGLFEAGIPGAINIFTPVESADGTTTLATVDDVIAALDSVGLFATEIGTTTVVGVEARVFEIRGVAVAADGPLLVTEPGITGWFAAPFVQFWIAETDRGLLAVTAEAGSTADLPAVVEETEKLLPAIELTDPPECSV